MVDQQVGNIHGVTSVGGDNLNEHTTKLSDITANGTNTVTVDNLENIQVGMSIDIVTKADGTVVAADREVDSLTDAGVLTYSGDDETTDTDDAVYAAGGFSEGAQTGFFDEDALTIAGLRRRLKAIDGTLYTDAHLNSLTYNDLVYAVRVNDHSATVN